MSSIVPLLKRPLVALAIIAVVAAVPRFYHLGQPPERVFDEVYYSKDACLYAGHTPKQCDLTSSGEQYWVVQLHSTRGETSWVHPQLGKWAIAAGILGEGNTPFGWRVASAAAGTVTVVLTAYMAWLLFGSILWTYIAGLLLATETLTFVQSRVSMLDIFLAMWVVVGFTCLLLDRRWIDRRPNRPIPLPEPPPAPGLVSYGPGAMAVDEPLSEVEPATQVRVASPVWRPWRFATGFAFGAAASTKWSGVMALGAAAGLAFAWEITRRRRARVRRPVWDSIKLELLGCVLAFLIVPLAVYLVSYTRYFVYQSWHPSVWWDLQKSAWQFHAHGLPYLQLDNGTLKHTHPYESRPWLWLAMTRPVSYYFKGPGTEILAMGHPLLFWTSVFILPYLAVAWIGSRAAAFVRAISRAIARAFHFLRRGDLETPDDALVEAHPVRASRVMDRRDWRAGFIVVVALAQYLPWFLAAGEVQFLFYILPVVPFLVLAAVYMLRDLTEIRTVRTEVDATTGASRQIVKRPWATVAGCYVVLYVLLFVWFYPILTGWHLSYAWWHWHMWMRSWI